MSRINTNVNSMLSQRILGQQNKSLNTSLERLSTGFRINRGKDDPAGLIASENLRAEKAAIGAAIGNAERADQVINIAEGGLTEISNLLEDLEGLIGQSANDAGLTVEEKRANQLQVDSILQTIDRIANSTSFAGVKLLNGNFDYTLSNHVTTELKDVSVDTAKIAQGGFMNVDVSVTQSAQTALVELSTSVGGGLVATSGALTVEVAGNKGLQQLTFSQGTSVANIVSSVNAFKDVTGVSATASGVDVVFNSQGFGSSQFVSVTKISGSATYDSAIDGGKTSTDKGRDATVNINGSNATVDGLVASISTAALAVTVEIDQTENTNSGNSSFQITGGGATFQLAPKLDLAGKAALGIGAVTTARLGSTTNGLLAELSSGGGANVIDGDIDRAQRVIEDSIKQVSSQRGRLGSFQTNTINAMIRSLGVALENTSSAESQIRDTDFASATADLTRGQILVQAATNVLSMSNSQPQSVLSLLG